MSTNNFVSLLHHINGLENTKAVAEAQAFFTAKLHKVVREGGLGLERELYDWFGDARFHELLDGGAPSLEEATMLTQPISQHEMAVADEHRAGFEPITPHTRPAGKPSRSPSFSPSQIAASVAGIVAIGSLGFAITSMNTAGEWQDDAARAEAFSARLVMTLAEELPHDAPTPVIENLASDAIDYFQAHGEFADPEALRDWSRLFTIVGRQRWNAGNTAGAREAFQTAVAATQQRLNAAPDDLNATFDHSQAVFYLADFNYRNGDFDAAETGYDQYAALTTELYEADPERPLYQAEYAYGFLNAAIMDWERGRIDEALEGFTAALSDLSAVAETSDVVSAYDVANAHDWRARAFYAAGRFEDAVEESSIVISTYDELPYSVSSEFRMLGAMARKASSLFDLGNVQEAAAIIDEGSERAEELLNNQPDNIAVLRRYLGFMLQRIDLALAEERPLAGKLIADHARSTLASNLQGTDRIVPTREAANFALAAAEVALTLGAYETASNEASTAISLFASEGYEDRLGVALNAYAYQIAGEAHAAQGRPDIASRSFLQGLAILNADHGTISERIVRARLEYLVGNTETALELRNQFTATGYSHPRDVAFWKRINQSGVVQNDTGENLNGG